MDNQTKLHISKRWLVTLFVYYFLVFIIGNIISLVILMPKLMLCQEIQILESAVIGSVGMSLLGSSIFYIRKLYKSCIISDFILDVSTDKFLIRLGTIVYYLARPLFAVGFSILVVTGLLSGLKIVSNEDIELNQNFVYMTMFLSFYVGFLTGRFVKNLENSGNRILKQISHSE